jgi:hypothetical protein
MKYLQTIIKWWNKNNYQFYRKEYERIQNRLLTLTPIPPLVFLTIMLVIVTLELSCLDFVIQLLGILMVCCTTSLFTSAFVLRWVDEHEKKLSIDKKKKGGKS